jgi:diguanylate cyclase (GGDEF)-like protein
MRETATPNRLARPDSRFERAALRDPLTGLAGRRLFLDRLAYVLDRDEGTGTVAVFLVDLDRFKLVNDSLGHEAGDRLLAEVARRVRLTVPGADTVARLGGNEFGVLCTACSGKTNAHSVATRLTAVLAEPVWLGGKSVYTSASIGVLLPGELPTTPADVMRDADAAMRAAKRRGKGRYELFDATMRGRALDRIELETDLRRALETEEIVPYFQPIVDVQTGNIHGVEALVRWQHPQRGLISPGEFLPICEETGLIVPLGRRVLREACHQVQRWREWFGIDLRLSVNLSVAELDRHDLLDTVTAVLDETGTDPGTLCLEITEHALMTDASHCIPNLAALDQLGVALALDDFGTGYSSLAYLRKLPIGILKIDRAFMTGDELSPADAAIIEAIIGLARALGLQTVAEGIETEAQWAALKRLGCEFSQGFLFSRPLPAAELGALLDQR